MKKSRRHTAKEMFAHYEAWQRGDVPQKQYCKEHGLAYSTFQAWGKKLKETNTQVRSEPGFIPVNIKSFSEPEEKEPAGQLRLIFPNGIQMLCPETVSPELLKNLINL